jgi:hypothetical protein
LAAAHLLAGISAIALLSLVTIWCHCPEGILLPLTRIHHNLPAASSIEHLFLDYHGMYGFVVDLL